MNTKTQPPGAAALGRHGFCQPQSGRKKAGSQKPEVRDQRAEVSRSLGGGRRLKRNGGVTRATGDLARPGAAKAEPGTDGERGKDQ